MSEYKTMSLDQLFKETEPPSDQKVITWIDRIARGSGDYEYEPELKAEAGSSLRKYMKSGASDKEAQTIFELLKLKQLREDINNQVPGAVEHSPWFTKSLKKEQEQELGDWRNQIKNKEY